MIELSDAKFSMPVFVGFWQLAFLYALHALRNAV